MLRSQRLRGFRYLRLNLLTTCRGVLNSFRPILAGNIRHATHLSESVESRGFSPEAAVERTSLRTLKMGRVGFQPTHRAVCLFNWRHRVEAALFLLCEWYLLWVVVAGCLYLYARGVVRVVGGWPLFA